MHAVSLHDLTMTDYAAETIAFLNSVMFMIRSPAMNVVPPPLFIRETMSGTTMTDVTCTTLHHANHIHTPGMVAMTMMTQADTDAVLVLLHGETEMEVHTPEAVFDTSLQKDSHTQVLLSRETSISCC